MLSTVDNLKSYLGITGTGEDALLGMLLAGASGFVAEACGRVLEEASITELYDGGSKEIVLREYPVSAITSVSVGGTAVIGYSFDEKSGVVIFDAVPASGKKNVIVEYTAGYASDAIPAGLSLVALELAARTYKQRKSQGIKSEALGSARIDWATELSEDQKIILNRYRKPVL